jgi:hypothetical protein
MSPLTRKAQSLKFESKIPWSIGRRPKKPWKAQEGHLEDGNRKSQLKAQNVESQAKWQRRARKSSDEQEKLKINTEAQKSKKSPKAAQKLKINTPPWNQLPLTLSM